MKFKIDENLPDECAEVLRAAGFDADTVGDEGLTGSTDADVYEAAQGEGRVLITLDLDFSNVQLYAPGSHKGIVILRSRAQDKLTLVALLRRILPVLTIHAPFGELWIVDHQRIRFRS